MNKLLSLILLISFSFSAFTHSGRTDSYCGHNCSLESQRKGLCVGYHYHFAGCPIRSFKNDFTSKKAATFFEQINSKKHSSYNEKYLNFSKIFFKEAHLHNHSH